MKAIKSILPEIFSMSLCLSSFAFAVFAESLFVGAVSICGAAAIVVMSLKSEI